MCRESENICVKSLIMFGELEDSSKHTHASRVRQDSNKSFVRKDLRISGFCARTTEKDERSLPERLSPPSRQGFLLSLIPGERN